MAWESSVASVDNWGSKHLAGLVLLRNLWSFGTSPYYQEDLPA